MDKHGNTDSLEKQRGLLLQKRKALAMDVDEERGALRSQYEEKLCRLNGYYRDNKAKLNEEIAKIDRWL